VENEISKLLKCRKKENFLTTAVRDQLQELEKEDILPLTSDTCIVYIQELRLPFLMPLQPMDWISLKGKVTWNSVQGKYVFMKTVVPDLLLNEYDVFDEFSCVQKYYESSFIVWNEKDDQNVVENLGEILAHFTKVLTLNI
jgi:hypothetical protein